MADDADIADDYIARAMARKLHDIQLQNTLVKEGAKFCKECGEKMLPVRRKLGFQLCKDCAEETERRKALFADN